MIISLINVITLINRRGAEDAEESSAFSASLQ